MTPERWAQVKAALGEALELAGEARARYLAAAGAGDPELRRELEELLAGEERPILTGAVASAVSAALPEAVELGALAGPYRLEAEVGRGGMGTVYLARRIDGQYDARVAVKVARRDMDSAEAAARFRLERQVLAGLEHPHIARLLDGGVTADGRLYLVMELVEGAPIDRACAARRAGLEERLRLFRKVCGAVEYAHQHLVVHRDLKPSNVLVGADGEPKLVDFGIAKLLGGPAAGGATVDLGRFLTPGYASPEHLAGAAVTTASDVFSLGVLLHELLTGARPPPGLAEPPPASAVAEQAAAPPVPPRRLRGDLDRILARALRREPRERYRSVAELDDDLRRFLDGEPVRARPPTWRYRTAKWVGRNRGLATALAAAALLAVIGVASTAWEGHQAAVARRAAEASEQRARKRFDDVRRLAHAVIYEYSDAIERLSGSIEVRERLVRDALAYLDSLAADAGDDPGLLAELADAYVKIGDIQGGFWGSNLGHVADAERSFRKAAMLYETLDRVAPRGLEHGLRMAHAWMGPMLAAAWARNDVAATLRAAGHGQEILDDLARRFPASQEVAAARVSLEQELSFAALFVLGDAAGALRHAELGCRIDQVDRKAGSAAVEDQVSVAYCDNWMGLGLGATGDHREAVRHHRAAAETAERMVRDHPDDVYRKVDLAVFLARLAHELADGEGTGEALGLLRRGAATMEGVYRANRGNAGVRMRMVQVLGLEARVELAAARLAEADGSSARAQELARGLDAENAGVASYAGLNAQAELLRGEVLERRGRTAGAREAYRAAAAALGRLAGAPEHLEARWQLALARAGDAALDGRAGAAAVGEQVAVLEDLAARDPASALRKRELARWYARLSRLAGEPPGPGSCAGRPWMGKAARTLRALELAGGWLGADAALAAACR